jgi:hypothetical protein
MRAFVVERSGEARLRIQFEGCDATWQREVTTDRVTGRVSDLEASRLPVRLPCAPTGGASRKGTSAGVISPYNVGDRIRVRWRGSIYNANVAGVIGADRVLVHYEGYENAWDEIVPVDRIEGPR